MMGHSQLLDKLLQARGGQLIYDGVCNLCTFTVKFLNAVDKRRRFEYIPYQRLDPATRKKYGLSYEMLQGRIYFIASNHSVAAGANAIADICRILTPRNPLCRLFRTPIIRNLYEWIARRRYRLFGCRDTCFIAS